MRVGVGKNPPRVDIADLVLGHFDKQDIVYMKEAMDHAADAVRVIMEEDVNAAMNKLNGVKPDAE